MVSVRLLALLGLREEHRLLDIGCGSLRAGRLFIAYLQPDRYFGIEPERWLVEAAIRAEIGQALVDLKRPTFAYRDDFRLTAFGESFDFLLAASVFTHAALHQIRTRLREARQVMSPSALLLASAACGVSDYEGDT
jgi:cyclopropane fatty-acyl-phospholipid synthase-like methyltransferase